MIFCYTVLIWKVCMIVQLNNKRKSCSDSRAAFYMKRLVKCSEYFLPISGIVSAKEMEQRKAIRKKDSVIKETDAERKGTA